MPPQVIAPRGKSAAAQRSLLDYALSPAVGPRSRTELNAVKPQALRGEPKLCARKRVCWIYRQQLKIFPFLRSRASGVHPTRSACNRIRNRPVLRSVVCYFIPGAKNCQPFLPKRRGGKVFRTKKIHKPANLPIFSPAQYVDRHPEQVGKFPKV